MKLVIDATAGMSGGKVYLDSLLREFARQPAGNEYVVFHTGDFDEPDLQEATDKFHFHRVKLPAPKSGAWIVSSLLKMLWRLFVLPVHLARIKPDILFLNGGFGPVWGDGAIKSVIALHNSMPLRDELIAEESSILRRLRLLMLRRFFRRAFRRCSGSIVFSEDTRQRVLECIDDLRREPTVIHHGVDWGYSEREAPADSENLSRLGITKPYLLFVSQFHRYKNLPRLLEGFAAAAAKHPDLSLVLAGDIADQRYWREVENKIERSGIRNRVKHIRACPREQLIGIYHGALAFVHPSLAETCSFPLLEALALGLPIAAARSSALPEIAGEAAIYFDPYNPREIADALDLLIWDESLRDDLSRKAIQRAEKFSWPDAAQQTLKVFEEIANCRRRS
jgi:glycosyltransferase involved in cell wall biosynthesis